MAVNIYNVTFFGEDVKGRYSGEGVAVVFFFGYNAKKDIKY